MVSIWDALFGLQISLFVIGPNTELSKKKISVVVGETRAQRGVRKLHGIVCVESGDVAD